MNAVQSGINPHYNDCYFSESNGMDESYYVFIEGNNLPERLCDSRKIHIGETGFGTGLNLLSLLNCAHSECSERIKIKFSSIEKYPLAPQRIRDLIEPFYPRLNRTAELYLEYWENLFGELHAGWNRKCWNFPSAEVDFNLYWGDVRDWCRENYEADVDAWFLDGHSPEKNPEIWSEQVMQSVYDRTAVGGTLASFTASGAVKRPLREAGFFIKRKKGFATKRHMIQGVKS